MLRVENRLCYTLTIGSIEMNYLMMYVLKRILFGDLQKVKMLIIRSATLFFQKMIKEDLRKLN